MDLWETIKRIYMPEFLLCRRPTQGNSWTQVFEGNVGNTAWPHYFKTTMINNKEKTLTSIANLNKSVTSNEKVIQQRKAQDQMASLNWYWLFSVIQNTKENFCQSIPPDQNQPDTQIRQKHKSKKKLIFLTSKDIKKKNYTKYQQIKLDITPERLHIIRCGSSQKCQVNSTHPSQQKC